MCYSETWGQSGSRREIGHKRQMEDWVNECLRRRKAGDKVEVSGPKGEVYQLGGQEFNRRHFFGLCPGCLKIGEHSACSGRVIARLKEIAKFCMPQK